MTDLEKKKENKQSAYLTHRLTQQTDYHPEHRGRAQNVVRLHYVKRITVKLTLDYTAFR